MNPLRKYYSPDGDDEPQRYAGVIDAHVHFWKYDKKRDTWITNNMKVLRENYYPEHLALTLRRNGVDGVVAVQADQSEVETRFLAELANTHPVIKGVVGWIDLRASNLEDRLAESSQYPVVKGWRHIVQSEPGDFLLNEEFQRSVSLLGEHNYTYDILIYPQQLPAAAKFISKLPSQKLIIDHCAKPDIRNRKLDDWKKWMEEIAQHSNVYCKVSGLFTEAAWKEWTAADFYPYLDVVFNAFGINRVLFGSDWPVMLLSGIYVQWKSLLEKYLENFSQDDKDAFFGLNAKNFYNL